MILTDSLPTRLTVCENEYEIRTDFRDVLIYGEAVHPEAEDLDIIKAVDRMYKGNEAVLTPESFMSAMQQLNWFIACGNEETERRPPNAVLGINRNKPFDFGKDGGLIYSAFIQSYGIDLYDIPYLHWWKFNALLADVDKDCRFAKIMEYRTMDLKNKHLSKEQKKLYSALQSYYKIPEKRSASEDDFIQALLEGRDPMKK